MAKWNRWLNEKKIMEFVAKWIKWKINRWLKVKKSKRNNAGKLDNITTPH